ncbi:hypothetical protein E1N66_18775, partial [Pantoea allii]
MFKMRLSVAIITTEILSMYLYKQMKGDLKKQPRDIDTHEVESYLENETALLGKNKLYQKILLTHFGNEYEKSLEDCYFESELDAYYYI